jgi:F-type H+-transporting ATPase subunit delta
MAEKITIARPYAKALFELAFDEGKLAIWSDVLAVAAQVASDERVRRLLVSPHVTTSDMAELFTGIVGPIAQKLGEADQHVRNLLQTLAVNRRLGLVPEISQIFEKLKAESENTADVTVTSAVPLNDEQEKKYASVLRNRLRREVRLHKAVDPSLLGGAVLRADDLVIDGSLRGRLERLGAEVAG